MAVTAFATEAALCAAFGDVARESGFTVYAETGGWDMLLVDGEGVQLGVQAKLRANLDVVAQALDPREEWAGPDFHAVLVPKASESLGRVCRPLRIAVYDARHDLSPTRRRPRIQAPGAFARWKHKERLWIPPVIPDVAAGVPAPVQVTRWKIAAIRLCLRLRDRGYVTSRDFAEFGIGMTTWRDRWVIPTRERDGRFTRYVAKPGARLPIDDHPDIAGQIAAEAHP